MWKIVPNKKVLPSRPKFDPKNDPKYEKSKIIRVKQENLVR